jgi:hypothetical protein
MSFYGNESIFAEGGGLKAVESSFADPFRDAASMQMPTTMRSVLFWSEAIWTVQGTYRMAMERIISYFLTDIDLTGVSDDEERTKFLDFLKIKLNILTEASIIMRDRFCYGNAFVSIIVPFRRYLRQPHTGDFYPLSEIYESPEFKFKFSSDFEFIATDPRTGWRGAWLIDDRPREEAEHLIIKRWSPHEIEILCDPYTNETAYLWRIPEYYKRMVREGNLFHLERASKQVLLAIKNNSLFRFHPDAIRHLKEPTLAGLVNMGWGFPRSLTNFRQMWYIQVLRRYNEAIAMDYLIPLRLITPANVAGPNGMTDPLAAMSGGDFKAEIRNMITRRRKDPAGWHMLPFPVNYQMLGGDAKQLVPTELIEQAYDVLLNETGTPVEFYKGSLTTAAHQAPMALRLFESTHWQVVAEMNSFLQWACDTISSIMSWQPVTCMLRRVTMADDIEKRMATLQLMMSKELSGTTGLEALGYVWESEQRRLADEARMQQRIAERNRKETERDGFAAAVASGANPTQPQPGQQGGQQGGPQGGQQGDQAGGQQGGAMGPGSLPVSEYIQSLGPDVSVTPNELQAAAEQLATDLLGIPEGVKDSELRKLKKVNPTLHSIVLQKLRDTRASIRASGQQI